ncbi:hypothetical protein [Ruminiclostridium hungatei]|uniref:hypothetical protein n=1 Tax=Ruminiclostridium hungatei TaxID=48256 RepID=UPI0013FE4688|nr:hypothetical protein [Ruminiclostridium hungatei]
MNLSAAVPVSVKPVNERLIKYVDSLEPYFKEPEKVDGNLIKIRLLEFLYDLAATDENLMQQLMQLKHQVRSDIPQIVEENILNPVSLNDLAYLSGRSLSKKPLQLQKRFSSHIICPLSLDQRKKIGSGEGASEEYFHIGYGHLFYDRV